MHAPSLVVITSRPLFICLTLITLVKDFSLQTVDLPSPSVLHERSGSCELHLLQTLEYPTPVQSALVDEEVHVQAIRSTDESELMTCCREGEDIGE